MTAVPFDTLKLADRLEAGGFTAEQARTFAATLAEAASGAELATKADVSGSETALRRDLVALETAVKSDVDQLRTAVKSDIDQLRTMVKSDLVDLEQRMTIRLGGMLVVAVGVLLAAMRYMPGH